ncbi:hypothetical protein HY636_05800 [Candidatus Woesearchaeota archaeon]|nr:hypothetical protein [Candidatus Woesearchaeota archaeon]
MNKKQVAYQIGRIMYNNPDVILLSLAAGWGYYSIQCFLNSNIGLGIWEGVFSLYAGFQGLRYGAVRRLSYSRLKKIRADRESYPLEHTDRVIIDDIKGLEFLLSKTHQGEKKEWGTFLKAHDDKGRAVIYDFLDIQRGKERGLIGEGTRTSINLNIMKANEEGYNGYHHYHPRIGPRWFNATDFSIGQYDKCKPKNWINLLTFNMPEGPEIIGFNSQYVYIPTDKSKRELVKATPREIMEYLRA